MNFNFSKLKIGIVILVIVILDLSLALIFRCIPYNLYYCRPILPMIFEWGFIAISLATGILTYIVWSFVEKN
ncbi:MAG: hypothetical protein WC533_04140 [Candidatus Pacearchaeota archaeon]